LRVITCLLSVSGVSQRKSKVVTVSLAWVLYCGKQRDLFIAQPRDVFFCRNSAVNIPAAYSVEYGVPGVPGASYLRHSVGPITAHNVRDKSHPLLLFL